MNRTAGSKMDVCISEFTSEMLDFELVSDVTSSQAAGVAGDSAKIGGSSKTGELAKEVFHGYRV